MKPGMQPTGAMTSHKTHSGSPHILRLMDEVYREMYRLEEGHAGAELGLALALLRAWIATDSNPEGAGNRECLGKVAPICLQMIEAALKQNAPALPCAQ
jgi:hypothetical protein